MSLKNWWIFLLLLLVTVADIYLAQANHPNRIFSKFLLMPLLAFAYIRGQTNSTDFARLIIAALFFSWLGDIFLMFDKVNSIYFIVGLCCFLAAHLLYIIYFLRIHTKRNSYLKKRPVMLLVIIAYMIELLYILWPSLGSMRLPVIIYAIVIGTMLSAAAWQYEKIPLTTALLFIGGAFLFVLSDSALALNRFHKPFQGSGIFVMLTYVAGQTMIVLGSLSHLNKPSGEFAD
jgi:uncharacterized membrane protein YhhN